MFLYGDAYFKDKIMKRLIFSIFSCNRCIYFKDALYPTCKLGIHSDLPKYCDKYKEDKNVIKE